MTLPSRAVASWLACAVLLGLTMASWSAAGHRASPWTLAALALLKVSIIGAVFLELDRSRRLWALIFLSYFAAVLASAAWLIAG